MPPRKKPQPKKTSKSRAPKKTAAKRAAPRIAARKKAATARKTASRRTASKRTGATRPRGASPRPTTEEPVDELVEETARPVGGPVAVGWAPRPLWEQDDASQPPPKPPTPHVEQVADKAADVTRPFAEVLVGVLAAFLAGSVFLPWYHLGLLNVSGWSSGTWGPIIFFLSLAALALILLRRLRIPVALPVEPTLVVEAIGWVAVIGLILKRYLPPKVGFSLPTNGWIFVSLVAALALAVLAGVASSDAPFVFRPGWFRGKAGKLGALIVVLALAGGVTLGLINDAVPTAAPVPRASPGVRVNGFPSCAQKLHLPIPAGFTASFGIDTKDLSSCYAVLTTKVPLTTAYDRYSAALQAAGFTLTPGRARTSSRTLGFRGDSCGSVGLTLPAGSKTVQATAAVFKCPRILPS